MLYGYMEYVSGMMENSDNSPYFCLMLGLGLWCHIVSRGTFGDIGSCFRDFSLLGL
jgi:hypothetical protein